MVLFICLVLRILVIVEDMCENRDLSFVIKGSKGGCVLKMILRAE